MAASNRGIKSAKGIFIWRHWHKMQMFVAILLCTGLLFLISCGNSDSNPSKNSQKAQGKMYYSVKGNEVVVHNTPWGDQSYTIDLPPGAKGGAGNILVGEKREPRIEIVFFRNVGVVSVTVDGVKVPPQ